MCVQALLSHPDSRPRPTRVVTYGFTLRESLPPACNHLPPRTRPTADQLPSALQLPPQTFFQAYRFPKPAPGTAVVLHSRTSKRAVWAAQLCADAGLDSVLVYRAGVYGWRFDESVKQYKSYELVSVRAIMRL